MDYLAGTNIKFEGPRSNEREGFIYQASADKLSLNGYKSNQNKDFETKHHLT